MSSSCGGYALALLGRSGTSRTQLRTVSSVGTNTAKLAGTGLASPSSSATTASTRTVPVITAPAGTDTHTARPSVQGAAVMPAVFASVAPLSNVGRPAPALSHQRPRP